MDERTADRESGARHYGQMLAYATKQRERAETAEAEVARLNGIIAGMRGEIAGASDSLADGLDKIRALGPMEWEKMADPVGAVLESRRENG